MERSTRSSGWWMLVLGLFVALLSLPPGRANAQVAPTPDDPCKESSLDLSTVVVPLDASGIGDWRFINPRRPYPLVRKQGGFRVQTAVQRCYDVFLTKDRRVVFRNETGSRTYDVVFKVSATSPAKALRDEWKKIEFWWELSEKLETETDLDDLQEEKRQLEVGLTNLDQTESRLLTELAAVSQLVRRRTREANAAGASEAEVAAGTADLRTQIETVERDLANLEAKRGVIQGEIKALEERIRQLSEIPQLLATAAKDNPAAFAIGIELLQRKSAGRPVELLAPRGKEALRKTCAEKVAAITGLYGMGVVDDFGKSCLVPIGELFGAPTRDPLVQAMPKILEKRLEEARQFAGRVGPGGATFGDLCKAKGDTLDCKLTLQVQPGSTNEITWKDVKAAASPEGFASFSVSAANEADIVPFSTGYLATSEKPTESASATSWEFAGSIGAGRAPELVPDPADTDVKVFSVETPYAGQELRTVPGSANFKLTQTLGNRALGTATLAFKSGNLGDDGGDTGTVKVTDYRIATFGDNGLQLVFGKYQAIDTRPLQERGEGFELGYRNLSLGYVIKRESLAGKADDGDQDHRLVFAKALNLALGGDEGLLARLNVVAAMGEDEKPEQARRYWTIDAKFLFASPNLGLTGDLEVFHSERTSEGAASTVTDGRGNGGVLTVNFNKTLGSLPDGAAKTALKKTLGSNTTIRSVGVQVGYGSSDDPGTARDESYLGESAGFKPDKIFLASFAGKIGEGESTVLVPPGLANKLYTGITYTENTISPLAALARWFGLQDKINSRSSVLKLHHYRFDEPVLGSRNAGNEFGIDFNVEVPQGITTSLGMGWFFAGDALEDVFDEEPWVISAAVKVTLK